MSNNQMVNQIDLNKVNSRRYISYLDCYNGNYYVIIDYRNAGEGEEPKFNIKFKNGKMAKDFYDKNMFWYATPNIDLKDDIIEIKKPEGEKFLVKVCCFDNMQHAYKLISNFRMQYENYQSEKLKRTIG